MKQLTLNLNFNDIQGKGKFTTNDKELNITTKYKVLNAYEQQPEIHSLKVVDDMGRVWLAVCNGLTMQELIHDLKANNASQVKFYPWINFTSEYLNRGIIEHDLFGNPNKLNEVYGFASTKMVLDSLEKDYQENGDNLSRDEFLDDLDYRDLSVNGDKFTASNPDYELWIVYNNGLTTAYEPVAFTDELDDINDNSERIFDRYYWQLATVGVNVDNDFLNLWF